jgi:hypothetical protein
LSTGQLIVTIACVGLLGAVHLVLRAARAPAGAGAVAAPRTFVRRDPFAALLAAAALAALVVAGAAFVVSAVDDDDDEGAAPTARTTTTAPATATAPPPPQPPPPTPAPLETPSGTALVAHVIANADGSLSTSRNRVGERVRVAERETGVYAVTVPGLTPRLRRQAVVRARPVNGAPGVKVSARNVGPVGEFVVFTREAQSGDFTASAFELAVYLPKEALEGTAGEASDGQPKLPPTR